MSEPITENEALRRALIIFPDAYIGEDSEKQLVVYTGLYPAGTITVTERVYGPEPKLMSIDPDWRNTSNA